MTDVSLSHTGVSIAREAGNAAAKLIFNYKTARPRSLSAIDHSSASGVSLDRKLHSQYRPLDFANYETRFLELRKDSDSDVPVCSLRHGSLVDPPKYVALSYAWGDSKEATSIVLEGTIVRVSTNLKAALQEMLDDDVTCAWVDALCIDQANLFERSYQVSLMGKIYAKAVKVVAWLGLPADDSDIAMEYLQDSADERSRGIVKDATVKPLKALSDLFSRLYWTRMWIVQELAKAKDVELWCGIDRVSWSEMVEMDPMQWLEGRERMLFQNIHHFRSREQSSQIGVARMLLSEALLYTNSLEATDSRDKVYALLGLTLDGADVVPTPSYNSSAMEIFRQISTFMIQAEGQTALVLLAGRRQNCPGLPSWLPIWCELEKRKHQLESTGTRQLKPVQMPVSHSVPEWIARCVRIGRETLSFTTIVDHNALSVKAVRLEEVTSSTQSAMGTGLSSRRLWYRPVDPVLCVMLELWEFFLIGHTRTTSFRLARPEQSPFWTKDSRRNLRETNLRKGLLLARISDADMESSSHPSFRIINNWFRQHRSWPLHEHSVESWITQFRRRAAVYLKLQLKSTTSLDALHDAMFEQERDELNTICPALGDAGMKTIMTSGGALRLVYKDAGPSPSFSPGSHFDAIYRLENCALPVVLRRISSKGEALRFQFIGEVFLTIQDDFGHWTRNTGWSDEDFREEAWKYVTIV